MRRSEMQLESWPMSSCHVLIVSAGRGVCVVGCWILIVVVLCHSNSISVISLQ